MGRPKIYDEALRNRLLDEASKMLARDGYRGVSLRLITEHAETSTNAVYTLFGSKEALMAEVILRDLEVALVPVMEAAELPTPEEALVEVPRRIRSMALANPALFTGAFEAMAESRQSGSLTDRINPSVTEIDKKLFEPILSVCKRVAAEPDTPELNAARMAMMLWASVHGFIVLELAESMPSEDDEVSAIFDDMLRAVYMGWTAKDLADLVVLRGKQ